MTTWQPLSVRNGSRESDGPYEGMPDHIRHPVNEWLRERFGWFRTGGMDHSFMSRLAMAIRIPVRQSHDLGGISNQIFSVIEDDEELYLDCLDAALNISSGKGARDLEETLRLGGSVWTVKEDGLGLERRVAVGTSAAYAEATRSGDSASQELKDAWSAAFGRNPNPSDAWDHAIKAVEDLLIPIVVPKANKPNLGTVAGEIKANPEKWNFGLPSSGVRNNGETLEGLLRHIWPNPDRHGGLTKRAPTQDEAIAVVQIAVAVVGLCRSRLIESS